ncbi:MAG: TrmH family RNA methyltransferase [Gammaproteobacteria bacterium]|nr:MAG: TrmH family RNA methyltransferase [Gammaproteobacteria bacterium]
MENIQLDHTAHETSEKKYSLSLLLHDISVPMNIGSVFRIADALGVEKIYLTGESLTPPNSKINKTSRSTEKYVPYVYEKDPLRILQTLKSFGYKILSLEITTASVAIDKIEIHPENKICLILGAESSGVSQQLLNESDSCVHIPMLGKNSSMNVATACAIAVYELTKRLGG